MSTTRSVSSERWKQGSGRISDWRSLLDPPEIQEFDHVDPYIPEEEDVDEGWARPRPVLRPHPAEFETGDDEYGKERALWAFHSLPKPRRSRKEMEEWEYYEEQLAE